MPLINEITVKDPELLAGTAAHAFPFRLFSTTSRVARHWMNFSMTFRRSRKRQQSPRWNLRSPWSLASWDESSE